MASHGNESDSEKRLLILKEYINGLKTEEDFCRLKSLKDFRDILAKPNGNSFEEYTFDDLSTDIAELVDNVRKADSKKAKKAKGTKPTLLDVAESLRKHWREELEFIRCCIDCYYYWTTGEEDSDYFTLVCTKPHLLVYVQEPKKDGSRWWPAKVLSVNENGTVNIECFGDHLPASHYKFKQCRLYADSEHELHERTRQAKKSKIIFHKKEFACAFTELAKYIGNVKQNYAGSTEQAFVPLAKGQKITDVNQHLKDMFPAAFAEEIPMPSDSGDTKPQATHTDTRYEADYNDEPHVATAHRSSISQGYESRGSDSDDSDYSSQAERHQQPAFRIEQIKYEYQVPDADEFDCEPPIRNGQKRKSGDCIALKSPPAKRVAIANVSNEAHDEVVIIADDEDTERPSTSTQNHHEQSPDMSENNDLLLDEFSEISRKIALLEKEKEELLAQEAIIREKLKKCLK